MKKKTLLIVFSASTVLLMALQSCNTNNHNPTVPGPLPTATSTPTITFTPTVTNTPRPTKTPTATPTATP